ncbi:tetratricopeptide repeat protein [Mucilaginibacter mali]|uniref:Tetratricopeptide repeat protein n=1 Tax=Mucilaginibacter mali TaxID=2740462 RepID=A0A7D4PS33_9SPHI|nr:tetratricopeptide repeat protein [Mucilaginibacter mali]QKJ28688.1 tetratricopeptide repeat protein [Mucilaginibacter mali]
MKYNRVIGLLICIAVPLLSFGADVKGLFSKGNQLYAKGQYKEAADTYGQIINSGYESAAVYFNMGNACYKNDEIPSAILYYEKAHKLSPGDEDINFNIRLTNLKTTDKIDEAPEFFLAKWWRGFILALPLGTLAVLSIICGLLASGILIWYLFTRSVTIKKVSFYVSIVLYIIGAIFIFMSNRQAAYFDNHRQAIIFKGTVTVKSAPASASKPLFVIHEGTKVDMLEHTSGQIKIRLANGSEGWIGEGDVKEI